MTRHVNGMLLGLGLAVAVTATQAQDAALHEPFVLASSSAVPMEQAVESTRAALSGAGFEVAGEYSPFSGTHVLVVTSDELRAIAARSEFGGYGAGQRVAVTQVGDNVQVSYVNPVYTALAYRMDDDLTGVAAALETALGRQRAFGSEQGLTGDALRRYQYMIFMPHFDDHVLLAEHADYASAVEQVEKGLAAGAGGTAKVYRIDLPGKEESVFGVAISDGAGADQTVMTVVDFGETKQSAHLPYELLVTGGQVHALHGKYRIALNFPDLGMGTFMQISEAPDGIETSLRAAAGGQ